MIGDENDPLLKKSENNDSFIETCVVLVFHWDDNMLLVIFQNCYPLSN